jgi:hypothetical protein
MNAQGKWTQKLAIAAFVLVRGASPMSAETTLCTAITSVPYTITDQGVYCLSTDIATDITLGAAITIEANNAVLDLNGHKLGGLEAGPGTAAYGIFAEGRQNITIRNGTIRGFYRGIFLNDVMPFTASQGHVVEDIRADQNSYVGIQVAGRWCLVQRTQVIATGGSTLAGANASAFGIVVVGSGHRVLDNDVMTVAKQGTGQAHGVTIQAQGDNLAVQNRITQADFGIRFNNGGGGKYRDNLTSSVGLPYSGGTATGNNN